MDEHLRYFIENTHNQYRLMLMKGNTTKAPQAKNIFSVVGITLVVTK